MYKTGVINDPLGQTHKPTYRFLFSMEITLFCAIFKMWERTDDI